MGRTPLKKRKKKPSTVFKSKIENRVRINIADISKSICKICLGKKPEIYLEKKSGNFWHMEVLDMLLVCRWEYT